jgi:hypothetical protein
MSAPTTSTASPVLNAIARGLYDLLNGAFALDQIDKTVGTIWYHYSKGELTDDEATFLANVADKRRPLGRRTSSAPGVVTAKPLAAVRGRLGSRFAPRRPPRSPDRQKSIERRRRLGGSSALPDTIRQHYTEGERAGLCIVTGEVKHHGICDAPIDRMAAQAGISRTTMQNALRKARRLGHLNITERPVPGRKHQTNLITIASPEWRAWIARGPSAHRPIGFKFVKTMSTTKNKDLRKKEASQENRCNSVPIGRGCEPDIGGCQPQTPPSGPFGPTWYGGANAI